MNLLDILDELCLGGGSFDLLVCGVLRFAGCTCFVSNLVDF